MTNDSPISTEGRASQQQSRPRHEEENASEKTDVEQAPPTLPKVDDDTPPDGGYGWVCVACCFFINGKNESFFCHVGNQSESPYGSLSTFSRCPGTAISVIGLTYVAVKLFLTLHLQHTRGASTRPMASSYHTT